MLPPTELVSCLLCIRPLFVVSMEVIAITSSSENHSLVGLFSSSTTKRRLVSGHRLLFAVSAYDPPANRLNEHFVSLISS